MKRKSSSQAISPGSNLGPTGKTRPPKVEKLKGGERPRPEQALGKAAKESAFEIHPDRVSQAITLGG